MICPLIFFFFGPEKCSSDNCIFFFHDPCDWWNIFVLESSNSNHTWEGAYFQMRMTVFLNHIEGSGFKRRYTQWIVLEHALIYGGRVSLLCSRLDIIRTNICGKGWAVTVLRFWLPSEYVEWALNGLFSFISVWKRSDFRLDLKCVVTLTFLFVYEQVIVTSSWVYCLVSVRRA